MMIKRIFLMLNVFLIVVLILIGLGTVRFLRKVDAEEPLKVIDNYELAVSQAAAKPASHYLSIIEERALFGSPPPYELEEVRPVEVPPRTDLKLRLKGIIYSSNPLLSRAIIKDLSSGRQSLYRLGDMVADAKIVEIKRKRVVIERGGAREVLLIAHGGEMLAKSEEPVELLHAQAHIRPFEPLPMHIQPLPEPPVLGKREIAAAAEAASKIMERLRIDPRNIREIPANIMEAIDAANEVLTRARIRPHFSGKRLIGIQVTDIHPGSIYERIGLRSGDIIKEINGHRVNSPRGIFQIYNEARQQPTVTISVDRGGQIVTLVHRINPL
jgi:general secretion pathway protein C